ncbi:MAG: hypothetical protein WKF36_04970 [Candidatus Nitrosocosmicus sp.]
MNLNDVPQYGLLNPVFIFWGLELGVFLRVTSNHTGSTTTWAFLRPNCLDDKQFEEQLQIFNLEGDSWKHALEGSRLRNLLKTHASFFCLYHVKLPTLWS